MTPRRLVTALLVLLLAAACVADPAPSPAPAPSATLGAVPDGVDMTDTLVRTTLPRTDPFALTRAVRGRDGTPGPWQPVRSAPLGRKLGDSDDFYFYNERTRSTEKLTAVVRVLTDHAYWYVQTGLSLDPGKLTQVALEFDGKTYPNVRRLYGEEWTPGIDGDPRISILLARIPDVGGYFSGSDELPRWVNPYSNEREMIYINVDGAPVGSTYLASTLAHEFAHMVEYNKRTSSAGWFNEALAQLAEHWNGATPTGTITQYLREPDTQLTTWGETAAESGPNYGHSFLFFAYLAERFGGPELIRTLMERGLHAPADLDAVLRQRGSSVEDAYVDFVATVALAGQAAAPAPYRFTAVRLPQQRLATQRLEANGDARQFSVHQYAARYFELPAGKLSIELRGVPRVRLLPTDPRSGKWLWWSNRGDSVDTTLTRTLDLTRVERATLTYWAWYDIEDGFDYAYVLASVDGGKTWKPLRSTSSRDTDPNGLNLGNGMTGRSGGGKEPRWVEERVDLTPFARTQIQLRFEYVTDQAVSKDGFAIDDLAVPEVGWSDDAESDGDWVPRGFVRSSNVVRERFAAQVLSFGETPAVTRARGGADGTLRLEVDLPERGGLLAVTAFAEQTAQPGAFEVKVTSR